MLKPRYNPNHEPAGSPEGGQFAESGGSGGPSSDSEINSGTLDSLPESAKTPEGAAQTWADKLDKMASKDGSVHITVIVGGDKSSSVKSSGLSGYVAGTVGKPNKTFPSPGVTTVIDVAVPKSALASVQPHSMTYGWSDKLSSHQLALLDHPSANGASVEVDAGSIPPSWISSVTVTGKGSEKNNNKLTVYHATLSTFKTSIKEKGLTVRGNKRNFSKDFYKGERGESIYVTGKLEDAQEWALTAAAGDDLDNPKPLPAGAELVILKVQIPSGQSGKLKPDEHASETSAQRYVGNIPPEWIVGISTNDGETGAWSGFSKIKGIDQVWYAGLCISGTDEAKGKDMTRKDASGQIVRKVHVSKAVKRDDGSIEFVMSDETVDRYGDIIAASGWKLNNFKQNPIALFGHNSSFPIGTWADVRVQGKELRGVLVPAPEGTSQRIDEIRRLVEAGILKAVSVGFIPLDWEKIENSDMGGVRYTQSELAECSVVSVPANPNALAVAKSLHISDDTMSLLFGKNAEGGEGVMRRRTLSDGENASSRTTKPKGQKMSGPLAKRIKDAQDRLVTLRDGLNAAVEKMDDNNPDEAIQAEIEEFNAQIETTEKSLATLQRAEASLARASAPQGRGAADVTHFEDGSSSALEVRHARPFAVAAKKVKPVDYLWRSLAVAVKHHVGGRQQTVLDVLKDMYGEDEVTRTVMARMVTKAAVVPASTTTSGWADSLVQTVMQDFIDALHPFSIYPRLAALGSQFTFGRNGIISMPSRSSTPTLAGAFVLQGNAIPVKQAAFSSITLTPKKMGVITTMTREIAEHSTPAIEGIIRQAILDDTAVSLDTILMDNNAATATRPEGLQHAAGSATTATSGGGIAALIGDLKALAAALLTATLGNIRSPVWIINPGDALAMALTQAAAGGDLPFRDELSRGVLLGYPIIKSTIGTTDTLYLVDAADFMTATGDVPRFDVSDQAVLHMEDTSPAAISAVGTPNTVAAPIRSLFQTDTMAIRMIMDVNWAWRRSGMAVYTTSMTWN